MTEQTRSALRELQQLDIQIRKKRDEAEAYEPRILEVEEPAIELEAQVERTRGRIKEMRVEERRLELATKEKRARREKLQDRLNQVRNVREESAVNAELEMVDRALETEESEAISLLEQIRRLELELEEQNDLWEQAKSEVVPRRESLVAERDAVFADLAKLDASRQEAASGVDAAELKLYDAIRGDGRRAALAALTADGACGNCFSVVPLQLQQEILRGSRLIRCEGCGVILAAPEPEPEEPEETGETEDAEAAASGSADGAEGDDASGDESGADETTGDEAADAESAADEETPEA